MEAYQFARSVSKDFVFCGYVTHVAEVARAFNLNHNTVRQRLKGGWDIRSAVVARAGEGWNTSTQHILANQPTTDRYCQQIMDEYFKNKPAEIDFI